ncbi:MAG TPA: ATP-binding protein [Pirellulales bacterium]|nr:ATP-binding protein [Pirellulales bacterium]
MTVDPGVIRSESHDQLGRLILENSRELIDRWQQRALEEQPTAQRAHRDALLDHLPDLLYAIAERLRAEGAQAEGVREEREAAADRHGVQRWETGWSLNELVRDYQILRLVLLDFLEGSLGRPLSAREAIAVGLELDDSIAESVNAYVRHSEQAIRAEGQHRAERDRLMRDAIEQGLMREAEALKASDRRKNEFLALLGHELRNPLGAMSNALALVQMLPAADPDHQQAAGVLGRQMRQMERLVDDLLDVSRITRGVLELRREQVDLVAAVEHAANAIRPSAERRAQRLDVVVPKGSLYVSADPSRLDQIITNLLVNSVKYTGNGGKIVCSVERQAGRALLRVIDNGMGISPDLLPQIFDMFMRAEQAARQEGGLGLGLTLVRNLVELHGGVIRAASGGPGAGSEFSVELPLAAGEPECESERTKTGVAQSPARARVLVVDDNHDVALTLAALVRHSGHDVRMAHDGPTALDLAKTYRPDVVLVDIGLPGMDGYDVARKLRDEIGLTDALLAALTGYGQEEDRRRSEEAGFDQHLIKPVRTDTLLGLIATVGRR